MEVLFQFTFQIVKIGILASIYSAIILFAFKHINKSDPESWPQKLTFKKIKLWLSTGTIISFLLFGWMFTYWGNHGLGDSARIPIGYDKEIGQINGTWSYISPKGHEYETYTIKSFAVKGEYCVGQAETGPYFIWNLKTNEIENINTIENYNKKATMLNLPKQVQFQSFWDGYQNYWGGWRFWLLP